MRPAGSPETCAVCELDPEFFDLLADAGFRLKARVVLITKHFEPTERVALFESLGLQGTAGDSPPANRLLEEAEAAAKRKGRSARFAVKVCSEYRYTCALTGYRCVTGDGATIVDAAHIESWATTQNDDPTNGLALSKNAHWMFDAGLWSADDHLRIIVNTRALTEHGPEFLRLTAMAGRHLQFDPASKLRPLPKSLRDHRHRYGMRSH
jgi:putative restriction endonuclease